MDELKKFETLIEKGYTATEDGRILNKKFEMIGNSDAYGYMRINFFENKKLYAIKSHRFIWFYLKKELPDKIDHINGIRDDNRLENLRNVSTQINNWNRKDCKGYSWDKLNKKWLAKIKINNKSINLGRYETQEKARQAYLDAKKKYHLNE
jgi:hypothetical protein